MIEYRTGDIFLSKAQALVNPVNCVGVMGAGLAKQFKDQFPDNFLAYKHACRHGEVLIGKVFTYRTNLAGAEWIINFPTKWHWKDKSYAIHVVMGMRSLRKVLVDFSIKSIAIPALGCGLGELDWREVKPIIEQAMDWLPDVETSIFAPQ